MYFSRFRLGWIYFDFQLSGRKARLRESCTVCKREREKKPFLNVSSRAATVLINRNARPKRNGRISLTPTPHFPHLPWARNGQPSAFHVPSLTHIYISADDNELKKKESRVLFSRVVEWKRIRLGSALILTRSSQTFSPQICQFAKFPGILLSPSPSLSLLLFT